MPVHMFYPKTLNEAYSLAKIQKATLFALNPYSKPTPKLTPQPPSKPTFNSYFKPQFNPIKPLLKIYPLVQVYYQPQPPTPYLNQHKILLDLPINILRKNWRQEEQKVIVFCVKKNLHLGTNAQGSSY